MTAPTRPDPTDGRDWLFAIARELIGDKAPPDPVVTRATPPDGFPPSVPVDTITFTDWSGGISVPDVEIARISNADDVAAVCNWAAPNGYTVRAVGHSHNWSPILLAGDTPPNSKVMLIDTAELTACAIDTSDGNALATFGTGLTLEAASAYLESVDNNGASNAPGYAFPQLPAPGSLTLGGALAIGAHGTVVPSTGPDPENDTGMMGCLSNLITGFDAVVTDPDATGPATYAVRHFERSDDDTAAFLVHLGRAFVTSVTLMVVPNHFMQMKCLFPKVADLFGAPGTTEDADNPQFATLLDTYGRVEVLWFPYNEQTFAQCNKREAAKIEPQVDGPYNYPWMNIINPWENWAIKTVLHAEPSLTPYWTATEYFLSHAEQAGVTLNGTARDLEIYLKDSTLRVTLFGWVLQLPRAEVQTVANQFYEQLDTMLETARAAGSYPINAAVEIRCTTVDRQTALPWNDAPPAALAATNSVAPDDASLDTVIWLNVGTIPGTPGANEFYTELESWIISTWGNDQPNRLRPEWSKAWAYTSEGAWTNTATIQAIRDSYNQATDSPYTLDWAARTLAGYDRGNLFSNPLLDTLFGAV